MYQEENWGQCEFVSLCSVLVLILLCLPASRSKPVVVHSMGAFFSLKVLGPLTWVTGLKALWKTEASKVYHNWVKPPNIWAAASIRVIRFFERHHHLWSFQRKSADPHLRQGRGGASGHPRCRTFARLRGTFDHALTPQPSVAASTKHSGHSPLLLRAFKPAVYQVSNPYKHAWQLRPGTQATALCC